MSPMPSAPHNRVALVTGAGSGIGQGCAAALLRDGWRVVYTGRRAEALQAAIAQAGDPFGDIAQRALALPCDVGDEAQVAALFDAVAARFGRLDLLFNNAGVFTPGTTPDQLDAAAWRRAVDTNLNGAAPGGRPFDIAVGQIDIGNVASEMTERMAAGILQADGSVRPEARMGLASVVDAFMTMARLPLDANVLFMTVMATKMPFVGRG